MRALCKETCLQKYGCGSSFESEEVKDKIKQSMLKNYGVDNIFKIPEVQDQIHEKLRNSGGIGFANPLTMQKIVNTYIEKYDTDNPSKLESVKNKRAATLMERYGIDNTLKHSIFREKGNAMILERYKVEFISQNKDIRKKIEATNIMRFGCPNPMQNPELAKKCLQTLANSKYVVENNNSMTRCSSTWELATVLYFIENNIRFEKDAYSFKIDDKRYYIPDFYLPDYDLWIEVKGRWMRNSKEKWDAFHETRPNSELWNGNKLFELGLLDKRKRIKFDPKPYKVDKK